MQLHEYIERFRKGMETLENYGYTESIEIKEEIRPNKQAVFTAKVVLLNGSVFQVREYIDAKYGIDRVSYAYHYQDRDGSLIFRYDNAAHRPALGFKVHKHTADWAVESADLPDVFDLINEIVRYL
jgi:Family of unknown function (DUF6516)